MIADGRQASKDGEPGGAGPEPAEEAADRRKVTSREGTASRAEAEHLEDAVPQDRFFEGDWVSPPAMLSYGQKFASVAVLDVN